ncbi:hypothetical protein Hanom_Chr00s000002g01598921 [Helianthus anomalus]
MMMILLITVRIQFIFGSISGVLLQVWFSSGLGRIQVSRSGLVKPGQRWSKAVNSKSTTPVQTNSAS